ncbi:MAG: peptide-methionine (R)-S-oxide reductase MsrB [Nanoarchaeota archaeon]
MDEEKLKKKLTAEQYKVLRERATERPGTEKWLHNKDKGMYVCAACGNKLFKSNTKFDSGTGWPSFYDLANDKSVKLENDFSMGIPRTEVLCAKCGSHLGHVFKDVPQTPTGKRYCINSCALDFKEEKGKKE